MPSALSTGARIRDLMEEEIATGIVRPGTRLDEIKLAERFGVSRTPVREALQQLAAAGLVQIQPRRGATVVELAASTLVEMFEVMAELEAMAARFAARRHTDRDKKEIQAALQACKRAARAGDADAYYYANETFHYALYQASHHAFLIEQCRQLHRRLKPYRRLQLRVGRRMGASLAEHEAITKAVLASDDEGAGRLARDHVLVQGTRFSDLVASLQMDTEAVPQ